MAIGRYLSLEEARKSGKLDRFAKEHPSKSEGDRFQRLLDVMTHGKPPSPRRTAKASQTSDPDSSAC